jgi:beta-lactamase superfamily II metal-dependent hydrolase
VNLAAAPAPTAPAVRVRMYDIGFGDCFLLRFPGPDRDRLVLIDCGRHSATVGGHNVDDIVADIKAVADPRGNGPRIDVVIASHRHQDHVSGFSNASAWADVEVGEVWLPWTENPDDDDARSILDKQSKRLQLLLALTAANTGPAWASTKQIVDNNLGYTNAKAMATLHRGFAGSPPRYFLPEATDDGRSTSITTDLLPGVKVHILGPLRSAEAIRDMNPPADDAFLKVGAAATREVEASGGRLPFDRWLVEQDDYLARFATVGGLTISKSELGSFINAARTDALALAVSLEKAVNGTSLMLMFECGDQRLLFPGDAQWGTWDRALADPKKHELLKATTFLKVGHHGSHNATPRRYVEQVMHNVEGAFVSVAPTNIKSWSQIPRPPLLKALRETCDVLIRSDRYMQSLKESKRPGEVQLMPGPDALWTEISLPTSR